MTCRGPWGIALTALLLCATILLAGCRKPATPTVGYVRLSKLVSLHPSQQLVADLDRRLHSLGEQRRILQAEPAPAVAPPLVTHTIPAVPPRATPDLSPALDEHQEQFLNQRLEAYEHLLDRDRHRKVNSERERQDVKVEAELKARQAEILQGAAASRERVQQQFYLLLLNTQMALDVAAERARYGPRVWQKRLETARSEHSAVRRRYDAAIAKINDDANQQLAAAELAFVQQAEQALTAFDADLKATNAALLAKKRQEFSTVEVTRSISVPQPVSMPALALPVGELTLQAAGLDRRFSEASAQHLRGREAGEHTVSAIVDEVQRQREELMRQIESDTRLAVEALALQHGYRAVFVDRSTPDITENARDWLRQYWGY